MWNTTLIFSNMNHGLQKKNFIEKNSFFCCLLKLLNYILYTHDVTCNLSRLNSGCNDIYEKDQ